MGIRTLKPTSPARRYMTLLTNEEITKKTPEKSLLSPKHGSGGRPRGTSPRRVSLEARGVWRFAVPAEPH
jgi:ribosomal protein L2